MRFSTLILFPSTQISTYKDREDFVVKSKNLNKVHVKKSTHVMLINRLDMRTMFKIIFLFLLHWLRNGPIEHITRLDEYTVTKKRKCVSVSKDA